jgi:hypothetical protein
VLKLGTDRYTGKLESSKSQPFTLIPELLMSNHVSHFINQIHYGKTEQMVMNKIYIGLEFA